MRSKTLQEAYTRAEALDAKLRADDPRLEGGVLVRHNDGTVLFFNSAFAEVHERDKSLDSPGLEYDDWWFIFTEHHDVHVYAQDEVRVRVYQRGGRAGEVAKAALALLSHLGVTLGEDEIGDTGEIRWRLGNHVYHPQDAYSVARAIKEGADGELSALVAAVTMPPEDGDPATCTICTAAVEDCDCPAARPRARLHREDGDG